jgi:beta-N-acetylhexosaminidase
MVPVSFNDSASCSKRRQVAALHTWKSIGQPFRRIRAIFLSLILGLLLAWTSSPEAGSNSPWQRFDRKLTAAEESWVRQTLSSLSLEEKIGQMMMAEANAIFVNRQSDEYRKLQHNIVDNKAGGVVLFRSDVWATAVLTNRFQELARVPLLFAADLEMGMGMRFDDTTWWAPNMAVGATGDPKWARLQGAATAREARASGINWIYAPDADVNNNPDNPVINTRSYGEDPQKVAAFATAFIDGVQAEGAMACAKHFPGHGDTAMDSHIGLPVVDVSRERLDRLELVPFRAAIKAGVGSIMSAHISLPQIESERAAPVRVMGTEVAEFSSMIESGSQRVTIPATLSPRIIDGILRTDLGFDGIVVTDAMTMAGVSARYDSGEGAVKAIKAGVDVVMKSPDVDAAIAAVRSAVTHGEISLERIDRSVERILRAKAALGLSEVRTVDLNRVDEAVSDPQLVAISQEIADRSITLVRDDQRLLPLTRRPTGKVLCVNFSDDDERMGSLQPFLQELRRKVGAITLISFDTRSTGDDIGRLMSQLDSRQYDAVIYALGVRARSGKGSVALPRAGLRIAEELNKRRLTPVVISFGSPYVLASIPQATCYLIAYSPVTVSQRAAAKALLGEIPIQGRLPVTLPGLYPLGSGLTLSATGTQ